MTREEEIIKQVEIYANDAANLAEWRDGWEDYNDYEYIKKAFINGAKWADKTMINRACERLSEIDFDSDYFRDAEDYFDNNQLVKEFRKVMEECTTDM